jgi:hypothetical protein
MPRRKKITETEIIEGEETPKEAAPIEVAWPDVPPRDPAPPSQDEKDINRFVASFGVDGGKVRIYKYDSTGNTVFAGPCAVDMISEEYVQAKYGEGKYQVRLINAQGEYVASKTLFVGPPVDGIKPPAVAGQPAYIAHNGSDLQMDMLRAELAASREMTLELVRGLAGRANGGAEKSSFSEIAEAMSMLKNVITPSEKSPMNSFTDMLTIFQKGIEIGQTGGASVSEKPWLSIAREVVSALPSVASAFAASKAAPAPAPEMIPAQNLNPLGIPQDLYMKLLGGISFLKKRAAKNSDVEDWVDIIVRNMDADEYSTIIPLAAQASLDQIAAATDPEISMPPYRAWFEKLFGGIKNAIDEQNAVESRPGGDGTDLIDDGGINPAKPDGLPDSKPVD